MANSEFDVSYLRRFSITTIPEHKNDDVFEDSLTYPAENKTKKKLKVSISDDVTEREITIEETGRENLGFDEISDNSSEDDLTCKDEDNCVEASRETPHRHMHKALTHGIPRKILNGERRHRRASRHHDSRKNGRITSHIADENLKDEIIEKVTTVQIDDEEGKEDDDVNDTSNNAHLTHAFPSEHADVVIDDGVLPHDTDVVFDDRNNKKGRYLNQISKRSNTFSENAARSKTLLFLLKSHLCFCSIGMIAHGLAGGLALTQCIFVISFFNQNDLILTESYSELAMLFQSLYYILLAISTVSIFDRYLSLTSDLSEVLKHIINKPIRAITFISYTLGLIFSVSLARLDEKVSMYKSLSVTSDELTTWETLNFLRVITAIAGWVTIALAPTDDVTAVTVKNMISMQRESEMADTRDINDGNTNILKVENEPLSENQEV